jgi:hypothetical protein
VIHGALDRILASSDVSALTCKTILTDQLKITYSSKLRRAASLIMRSNVRLTRLRRSESACNTGCNEFISDKSKTMEIEKSR